MSNKVRDYRNFNKNSKNNPYDDKEISLRDKRKRFPKDNKRNSWKNEDWGN